MASERTAKRLKEWSVGKSTLFSRTAMMLAFACEPFHRLLDTEIGQQMHRECVGRKDAAWERYYRSVVDWSCELPLEEFDSPIPLSTELIRFHAEAATAGTEANRQLCEHIQSPEFAEQWPDMIKEWHEFGHEWLAETIAELVAGGPEPTTDKEYDRLRQDPAVCFLIRVYLPCVIRHQQTPQALFERAAQGELDAIEKLMECDLQVYHLMAIRAVMESHDPYTTAANYEAVSGTMSRVPTPPTSQEVKYALASLISYLGMLTDEKVDAPGITELLNIAAQSRDKSVLVDPDFSLIEPDSFARSLRRKRKNWQGLLADTVLPEAVRALRGHAA